MESARIGARLVWFPEGTFSRMPGLLEFHVGAFLTAAQLGLPVVPVTIRGTRSMLRDGSWLPRRGAISVHIGAPIAPAGDDFQAGLALRNSVRLKSSPIAANRTSAMNVACCRLDDEKEFELVVPAFRPYKAY